MAKRFEITTNRTTFYHFCNNKKEAETMAVEIMAKMTVVYGDTIKKIRRVAR